MMKANFFGELFVKQLVEFDSLVTGNDLKEHVSTTLIESIVE